MKKLMVVMAAMAAVVAACGVKEDVETAMQTADTADMVQFESAIFSLVGGGGATQTTALVELTPEQIAAAAAEKMKSNLVSQDCAFITTKGAVITAQLNACTGTNGLVSVTGTVVATFSLDGGKMRVDVAATGLAVNRAIINIQSAAFRSVGSDGKITFNVTTIGSGTGPRGNALAWTGTYVAAFTPDTECRSLEGNLTVTASSKAGTAKTITVDVTGLARCGSVLCPKSGGLLVASTGTGGKTITLSFDGSPTLKWEVSDGKSGTISLECASN
ncbi:MAG: hypothetical protein WC889_05980 [Myxococcota bacterium]|jgi:hypothetical protein